MSLPARLGRLRQVERLGVGGFASVWLYHDDELESDVAVKALADNWAQRLDIRDRFLQEARILRRADSDHVVRVYDVGEVDGTPYFVMTYADQGTVADLLQREHRLPLARTIDLVTQAGAGLVVLHHHGSIHRDLKPANLLLRSEGDDVRVMVADLGVAKAILHASGLTHVVGTPAYMAPEQAVGLGVDERADVYALAAVTYQMLTGRARPHGDDRRPRHPAATAAAERARGPPARDRRDRAPGSGPRPGGPVAHGPRVRQRAATAGPERRADPAGEPARLRAARTPAAPPRAAGSKALLVLVCLAVFLACFGGALVVTQQLH